MLAVLGDHLFKKIAGNSSNSISQAEIQISSNFI